MDGLSNRWWSEIDLFSRNARMSLPIRHILNIPVDIQSTNVQDRVHLEQPFMPVLYHVNNNTPDHVEPRVSQLM
jgi:hypothetical protein